MTDEADLSTYLTTSQVARIVGVSEQRIRQMADDGTLANVVQTRHGRLYDPAEVEALAQERGVK